MAQLSERKDLVRLIQSMCARLQVRRAVRAAIAAVARGGSGLIRPSQDASFGTPNAAAHPAGRFRRSSARPEDRIRMLLARQGTYVRLLGTIVELRTAPLFLSDS